MALLLNQVVRVRVAVVLDTADQSVGQVYDEAAGAWADLVWVDLLNSTMLPLEFGDAECWAEVTSLSLTRSAVARPAVRLRAWRTGGVRADGFIITTSGSTVQNIATVTLAGADVMTNLPGLGAIRNTVRIRGLGPQRVGWTGRLPAALSWERTAFALRKRVKYGADAGADSEYLAGVAGFAGSIADLNAWLAANQPEYGSAITIGATLAFTRQQLASPWTYRYAYTAGFTIHASLSADGSGWGWTSRGTLLRQQITEVVVNPCGGRTGVATYYGEAITTSAANAAVLNTANHQFGATSGTFTTPPAGGGTVVASPRGALFSGGPSYGVDVTLTVNAQGRVVGVAITGVSSDGTVQAVTGWGACKQEGGLLA